MLSEDSGKSRDVHASGRRPLSCLSALRGWSWADHMRTRRHRSVHLSLPSAKDRNYGLPDVLVLGHSLRPSLQEMRLSSAASNVSSQGNELTSRSSSA